jgi:hypothetical protein
MFIVEAKHPPLGEFKFTSGLLFRILLGNPILREYVLLVNVLALISPTPTSTFLYVLEAVSVLDVITYPFKSKLVLLGIVAAKEKKAVTARNSAMKSNEKNFVLYAIAMQNDTILAIFPIFFYKYTL